MRVLMVDDHVMVLQGLKNLIGVMAPDLQIDTASSIGTAVELATTDRYDLVLLDWKLGQHDTGADAMYRLREAGCAARIVVVSGEADAEAVRCAIDLGAAGYVSKSSSGETMLAALDTVLQGGIFLPAETGQDQPPPALIEAEQKLSALTPRQADVYRAAARGLPNKLIARELNIAESTVKTHLAAIFQMLDVHNRTELAYHASREGIRVG